MYEKGSTLAPRTQRRFAPGSGEEKRPGESRTKSHKKEAGEAANQPSPPFPGATKQPYRSKEFFWGRGASRVIMTKRARARSNTHTHTHTCPFVGAVISSLASKRASDVATGLLVQRRCGRHPTTLRKGCRGRRGGTLAGFDQSASGARGGLGGAPARSLRGPGGATPLLLRAAVAGRQRQRQRGGISLLSTRGNKHCGSTRREFYEDITCFAKPSTCVWVCDSGRKARQGKNGGESKACVSRAAVSRLHNGEKSARFRHFVAQLLANLSCLWTGRRRCPARACSSLPPACPSPICCCWTRGR